MNHNLLRAVQEYPEAARKLIMSTEGEHELVDALGEINQANRKGGELKRTHGAELETGTAGSEWSIKVGRKSTKSYNTTQLLAKFAEATGYTMLKTIGLLLSKDVIRIEWQFTKLAKAAEEFDVTLATANHELTPEDTADIGKFWQSDYPTYERVDGPA